VKNLKDRLSVKIDILKLRFAMVLCYMAMAGDVVQRKSLSLSRKISRNVIPSEPEEPYVHVPSPIEKYTLDLTTWRGDDGSPVVELLEMTPERFSVLEYTASAKHMTVETLLGEVVRKAVGV
jgi:hypothetical protein